MSQAKVQPSDRLKAVVDQEYGAGVDEEIDAFWSAIESAPTPEDYGAEPRVEPLTWDDLGVTTDEDELRRLAEFFDGVDPGEDPEVIRERLGTVDVEVYVNAVILVRELNREG